MVIPKTDLLKRYKMYYVVIYNNLKEIIF